MPRTPDRTPGSALEEKLVLQDEGLTADNPGEVVYTGGAFSLRDSTGPFDPRSGADISQNTHKTLRQLVHLAMEGGPFDGFASGAFRELLGGTFPTSAIWWTSAAKTAKIVELTITYNSNKTPATEQWKLYDTDGSTVLLTATDTMAYTGINETSRTRVLT